MTLKYRPEVDGLRAIAVLSVIFYHGRLWPFSGGFVGVDVFFVISGYLITSIILGDIEAQRFSIRDFYERRIRRILPALYVVMAVCIPLAWTLMIPLQIAQFGDSLIAVCLFVSNILFWKEENYFAPLSAEKPLLHTWSLGIEEQYYLFFPLALWALWRFGRRPTAGLLVVVAAISLILSEWAWRHAPSSNFYLFPTRAWELLAGSLCAIWLLRREQAGSQFLAIIGLGAILAAIFAFDDATPIPSLRGVLPVGGTALIVLFATRETWVGRLLGSKPFVGVGLISYSAYLWHQPLFAYSRLASEHLPTGAEMFGLGMVSLALGYLSWRFVERPFRDRRRFSFGFMVKGAVAGAAIFIALGLVLHLTDGWKRLWAEHQPEKARVAIALMTYAEGEGRDWGAVKGVQDDGTCRFNTDNLGEAVTRRLLTCRARFGKGTLIIGDSHGIDLFGEVASRSRQPFLVGITQSGCSPHFQVGPCPFARLSAFLGSQPSVFGRVLFEEAGFSLMKSDQQSVGRDIWLAMPFDQPVRGIEPDPAPIATDAHYLATLARMVPVVWIGPRLEPMIDLHHIMRHGCDYPYRLRPGQEEVYRRLDRAIARQAAGIPNLTYVSQLDAMRFSFPRDFMDCRRLLWQDTDHFSAAGEVEFGKRLPPVWQEAPGR